MLEVVVQCFFGKRTTTSTRLKSISYGWKKKKSISKILGLNQSLILVGQVRDFGIEVRVGENHPRIWIIKNYVGKYCDNYGSSLKLHLIVLKTSVTLQSILFPLLTWLSKLIVPPSRTLQSLSCTLLTRSLVLSL